MTTTSTQIVSIASVPVTDGQLVRVPASGGVTIPTNLNFTYLQLIINLSTADKEAVGKSLLLSVYTAPGDTFVAGITWNSYGKQYTDVLPGGTVLIDPDPTVDIALANFNGQPVHLTYQATGISTAGVTINGLS